MYASLFGILGALHLDVFDQPEHQVFFSTLLNDYFNYRREWFLVDKNMEGALLFQNPMPCLGMLSVEGEAKSSNRLNQ